jgi:hypothetical protein
MGMGEARGEVKGSCRGLSKFFWPENPEISQNVNQG